MTYDHEAAEVAKGLSKAQRAYLTDRAVWQAPMCWAAKRWMTFPPSRTLHVLFCKNLCDLSGQISSLGLRVRAHLQGETA